MVEKTIHDPPTEVYHQSIPLVVTIAATASVLSSYFYFSSYGETGSVAHLVLANIFLLVTIIFLKPFIEWRRIAINNGVIMIYKLFFKPIRINISESLYQVVMKNGDMRSYRRIHGIETGQLRQLVAGAPGWG
jgi:hypothetical protein